MNNLFNNDILRRIGSVLVLGLILVAVQVSTPAAAEGANELVFEGTATTNVQLFDVYGTPKGVFTYQTRVQVIIQAPLSANGLQETNPFRFIIATNPPAGAPGEISLWSSALPLGEMFQYWQFSEIGPNHWQGVLADNHTREALALNLLTVPQEIAPHLEEPTPVALANNTQLDMALNGNQFTAVVQGNSTGATTPFQINIVANFVQQ